MKKKIILLLIFVVLGIFFIILGFFIHYMIGLFILLVFLTLSLIILYKVVWKILNILAKKTQWYRNQYINTNKFVTNSGYRDNIIRNYEIINLGSNPALYGFFYKDIKGANWSTGSQGLEMDFSILKVYHSYLKKGGVVLIPIMPFSSISQYIKNKPEYWSPSYYSKFAKLDCLHWVPEEIKNQANNYLQNPLIYCKRAVLKLFKDDSLDNKLDIAEQCMMDMELRVDADNWIKLWLNEFDLNTLSDVLDKKFDKYIDEAVFIVKSMISFCQERGYKPILVSMPMSSYLSEKFSPEIKKRLIYDFVKNFDSQVSYLNYVDNEEFTNPDLYINTLFFNLRGRKIFTQKVLSDIKF
jgi:hypothetical protein